MVAYLPLPTSHRSLRIYIFNDGVHTCSLHGIYFAACIRTPDGCYTGLTELDLVGLTTLHPSR